MAHHRISRAVVHLLLEGPEPGPGIDGWGSGSGSTPRAEALAIGLGCDPVPGAIRRWGSRPWQG